MSTASTLFVIIFIMILIVVSNVITASKRKTSNEEKPLKRKRSDGSFNDTIDMDRTTGIY